MTTRSLQDRGINLNTLLIIVGLITGGITVGKFAGPIFGMPERITGIEYRQRTASEEISSIRTSQTVQAEALKTLTSIAAESATTSRATDRLTTELGEIRRRLDRLETR